MGQLGGAERGWGWPRRDGSWGKNGSFRENGTNWKWNLRSAGSRAAPKPSMHLQCAWFVPVSSHLPSSVVAAPA